MYIRLQQLINREFFKTPILSGIRISPQSLDLIDGKIDTLFTKKLKKIVYFN